MNKRILELDITIEPEFRERLIIEESEDFVIVYTETYQQHSWKAHGWYSSPDEGTCFPKIALLSVINAFNKIINNKT